MRRSEQLSFERSVPRQVSALPDSGGEAQYVPFFLVSAEGKRKKKYLKTMSELPHFQRNSSTLIAAASRRKCPQISLLSAVVLSP